MMLFMTSSRRLSGRFVLGLLSIVFSIERASGSQSPAQADPGRVAMERGDYVSAEAQYRLALRKNPGSSELLTDLGVALQLQGRSTEAIHIFEQALHLKGSSRTYALLAEERCKTRDLDGARPMLTKILAQHPADLNNLELVAPCYLELDEPVEAVQVYGALLSDPAFPGDLATIQLARSYLRSAQFFITRLSAAPDHAIYMKALEDARDRVSPDARSAFGEAALHSTYFTPNLSFEDAVRLSREHPDDTTLLYLLAVLSGEGSVREIEQCYDKFPDSPYLQQLKLDMLAEHGHEDEAIQGYESLRQLHPELPDLKYDLGMLYRKQHMWDRALAVFRTQLAQDPHDERSAARVSEALVELMQWKDLRDFLEPRVNQKSPPLWAELDMAEALENLDEFQRAIQILVVSEKNNMSSKSVHYRLLLLYRKTGNIAQLQAENRWLQSAAKRSSLGH
jgi:tetratricopeptide (TPR) repeat protein